MSHHEPTSQPSLLVSFRAVNDPNDVVTLKSSVAPRGTLAPSHVARTGQVMDLIFNPEPSSGTGPPTLLVLGHPVLVFICVLSVYSTYHHVHS